MEKLEDILTDLYTHEAREADNWPSGRTAACPPMPRARALLLDASRGTDSERGHLHPSQCGFCANLIGALSRGLWHPSLVDIFRYVFNLNPSDARYISTHMDRDTCRRCRALATWMRPLALLIALAEESRGGVTDAVERASRLLGRVAAPTVPVLLTAPAGGQAFATDPPFFEEVDLEGGLVATFQEQVKKRWTDEGKREETHRLILSLQSHVPEHERRTLGVVVGGSGETVLSGSVTMGEPDSEGWIVGIVDLGDYEDVRQKLGGQLIPFVTPPDFL